MKTYTHTARLPVIRQRRGRLLSQHDLAATPIHACTVGPQKPYLPALYVGLCGAKIYGEYETALGDAITDHIGDKTGKVTCQRCLRAIASE